MLNEEKIRWMTKASIYEKRQGRIDLGRNEYFMGDYVRLHLLKNGISLTIAYILLAGLYVVYKIEEIFDMAANMQLGLLLKEMLLLYIILLASNFSQCFVIYCFEHRIKLRLNLIYSFNLICHFFSSTINIFIAFTAQVLKNLCVMCIKFTYRV